MSSEQNNFFNNVVIHVIENSKWLPGGHFVSPGHYKFHLGPSPRPVSNRCVKFHDYTTSSFRSISQNIKLTDGLFKKGELKIKMAAWQQS